MSVKLVTEDGRHMVKAPITLTICNPDAEKPSQQNRWDAVWNVNIVDRCGRAEDIEADLNEFSTGLILAPPKHYHLELIAHPALVQAGYTLLSPVIINPGNTDVITVQLYKFKSGEDLSLPHTAIQMLLRQTEHATPVEIRQLVPPPGQPEYRQEYRQEYRPSKEVAKHPQKHTATTSRTRPGGRGNNMF